MNKKHEIGFVIPKVSPFGYVRDLGKRALFPKSLTKPQGETLGIKKPIFTLSATPTTPAHTVQLGRCK